MVRLQRAASPPRGHVDIFDACRAGSAADARHALCTGADPNTRHRGQTPLMYAAEGGHTEICRALLDNGAAVNATDSYNRTALHLACKNSRVATARLLMEAGAAADVKSTLGGETAADIARVRGPVELVRAVVYFTAAPEGAVAAKAVAPKPAVAERTDAAGAPSSPPTEEGAAGSARSEPAVALSRARVPPPAEYVSRSHTPPRNNA